MPWSRRRWWRGRKARAELTCRELVEVVTDYLEGALPPLDRARFERHLAGCGGCSAYLEQMRATIRLTGRLTEDSVPGPAMEPLLLAFREWKAEGAASET
jgi:anti-sigma factor RsiW